MNIFAVDQDPIIAAQSLCNKHVVKMILESAQLLCSAHHIHPLATKPERFYKLTHKNHPCAIWTRTCKANYRWLGRHSIALLSEYIYRYGKIHASDIVITWCCDNYPNIPGNWNDPITPFVQAMPDECKTDDAVEAYRLYYNEVKSKTIDCRWTTRNPPSWFINNATSQSV